VAVNARMYTFTFYFYFVLWLTTVKNFVKVILVCMCSLRFPLHESVFDICNIHYTVGTTIFPRKDETFEQLNERVRREIQKLQAKLPPVQMPETSAKAIAKWKEKQAAKALLKKST
jgi:hypothetical protein